MKTRVLFIDRDGTLVEEPIDCQVDVFEKIKFYPGVLRWLPSIQEQTTFELVLVSNQDGLGTLSFPYSQFTPVHNRIMETFKAYGVLFEREHIDPSFPSDKSPNRKPEIGMLKEYFSERYDLENSFVIGDRISDVQLAENMGCKAIRISEEKDYSSSSLVLETNNWKTIEEYLIGLDKTVKLNRKTAETNVRLELNLNGNGRSWIRTGLKFFDHMLEQISKHANIDLVLIVEGDLEVDEHHTIEDVALTIGTAVANALGKKRNIERYGFALPMDDCRAQALIDLGGRPWLIWEVDFEREFIGDVPTEMFYHFFKSLSDSMKCNLHLKAKGDNEHHKIEAVFKAFAKALRKSIEPSTIDLASTKGVY